MSRVYNFSAGPAVLPVEVLQEAADEMLDYRGTGMSVMEMSHRSKAYDQIIKEAEADLRTRFTPSFIEKTKRCKESLILPKQILKLPEEAKSRQCGDGGVLCGLWELAEAEKTGFEIDFSKLALKQETVEICEFFQLNPYLLTSAGSYLVLTEHGEETLESLKNAGVPAVRIGFVKEQNARTLVNGEETRYLDRPAPDELSRWWKERKESELCIKTEE